MGAYAQKLASRAKRNREIQNVLKRLDTGSWTADKIARNLKDGYKSEKGLKDGFCNRYACQDPIGNNPMLRRPRPQWWMRDHERMTDEKLYYCQRCAFMFNDDDQLTGMRPRCTREGTDENSR